MKSRDETIKFKYKISLKWIDTFEQNFLLFGGQNPIRGLEMCFFVNNLIFLNVCYIDTFLSFRSVNKDLFIISYEHVKFTRTSQFRNIGKIFSDGKMLDKNRRETVVEISTSFDSISRVSCIVH